MYAIGIIASAVLAVLVVVLAVYRFRSRKRTSKALTGLECSQRKLGKLLGELSDEVGAAVSESAALISQLETSVASGIVGDWAYPTYRRNAVCRYCGSALQLPAMPTHRHSPNLVTLEPSAHFVAAEYHISRTTHWPHIVPGQLAGRIWGEVDDNGEWESGRAGNEEYVQSVRSAPDWIY